MSVILHQGSRPSFQQGFARSRGESANPNLWPHWGWVPSLGPTGGTLFDVSGNKAHGTLTNMELDTDWVVTSDGYAVEVDGATEYVDFGILDWTGFTASTIVLLYHPSSTKENFGRIFSAFHGKGGTGAQDDIRFMRNATNDLKITMDDGATTGEFIITTVDDVPNHIVNVHTGALQIVYQDGVSQGENARTFDYVGMNGYANSGQTAIGAQVRATGPDIGRCYGGKVISCLIYGRALTHGEVQQLYKDPSAPFRRRSLTPFAPTDAPASTLTIPIAAYHYNHHLKV